MVPSSGAFRGRTATGRGDRETGIGGFQRAQRVDLVGCETYRSQILGCGREPRPQADGGQVLLNNGWRDEIRQMLTAELRVILPGHGGPQGGVNVLEGGGVREPMWCWGMRCLHAPEEGKDPQ